MQKFDASWRIWFLKYSACAWFKMCVYVYYLVGMSVPALNRHQTIVTRMKMCVSFHNETESVEVVHASMQTYTLAKSRKVQHAFLYLHFQNEIFLWLLPVQLSHFNPSQNYDILKVEFDIDTNCRNTKLKFIEIEIF